MAGKGYRVESYAGGGRWAIVEASSGRMVKSGYRSRTEAARAMDRLPDAKGATTGVGVNAGAGGSDVDFGAINAIAGGEAAYIDTLAWQVINGTFPAGQDPGAAVLNRVGEIQRYLAGIESANQAAAGLPTSDAWAQVMAMLGGAGAGGGGTRVIGGGPAPDPVDSPEEIDAFVRENYGYLAGYLEDPEIGPILKQAAREGWDQGRLRGALSATNWWQTTSESAREWDALWNMDRATANSQIDARIDAVRRQAKALGLDLTGKKKDVGGLGVWDTDFFLAVQSLRNGWTPEQLAQMIFNEGGFDPEADYAKGSIASTADRVKAMAKQYFIVIGDRAANTWAQQILMGEADLASVEATFRDQAKGRYGALAEQIDAGVSPAQFFDSYQQQIAAMLEVDPDVIDLMDPKWSRVIEVIDSDGKRRPMTLAETADYVRTTPEWDQTDNARSEAARVAELLGKTFGTIG
jgi:hypothetical protein